MSMIDNLKKIKETGIDVFMVLENRRQRISPSKIVYMMDLNGGLNVRT